MAHSTEALRQPPPRRFENYVLTRVLDSSAGLSSVPDALFTQAPGSAGDGYTDDAYIDPPIPIGFTFSFDGIEYTKFTASTNGWMALVDPTRSTFSHTEVLSSSQWVNNIKSVFDYNHVLLAPWFDDCRNIVSDPSFLASGPFSYSATKIERINAGLEPPPIFYNPTSYGVSYYVESRGPHGRRLIVRWAVASNFSAPSSVIRFEVVLYENGTIEYRYVPRQTIFAPSVTVESATVGIFMSGGTWRFRDFSVGLGYRDDARQEYVYGGFVYDPAYTDSGFPYTYNLRPDRNWPGLASAGCILRFAPPQIRRKILPRKLINERDSRSVFPIPSRTGVEVKNTYRSYDDRKSPSYAVSSSTAVTTQVNYPTTMPRFFGGNGLGTSERQNLFSGDFLVTGTVVKSAIDQYVDEVPVLYAEAFSEVSRPDQSPTAMQDSFFTTGSSSDYLPQGFDHNLRSKTQVRISLPVNTNVVLPGASSSIYYYNQRAKAWEVPANSTYILATTGSTPPGGAFAGGDWKNPMSDVAAGRIVEDARGFGPIGNPIASGSGTPTGAQQTDPIIGSGYDRSRLPLIIGKEYAKSVRNNEQYRANNDETFVIPINTPFLIEKAVFEIPIAAGAGWFDDRTQTFMPFIGASSYDFAGPALTVALSRQVMLSETGRSSIRDLILTGTIIPSGDNTRRLDISNFPTLSSTYQIRPIGFLAYAGPPGAVVTPGANNTFTGSVQVQATALNTAGVAVRYVRNFADTSANNRTNAIDFLTRTSTLMLSSTLNVTTSVGYVSPLGRGGTGFVQSGRSIMGKEYATFQGRTDQTGKFTRNPFATGSLSAQHLALLTTSVGTFNAVAHAVIPVATSFPAPYLVMPGDRLVLSISKMRPVMYGGTDAQNWFSGSAHDIQLSPGNINITLYGSLVKEGEEFHDTLNQNLSSHVVHEMIGAEPVLDQFELAYQNEYTGSFTDNVMLGTLGTPAERDRKLSRLNARNVPALGTSPVEVLLNAFKGFRAQPWYEKLPDVRHVSFTDSSERFWDSMMPGIAEAFKADGSGIFMTTPGTFGDFRQVAVGISGSTDTVYNPKKFNPGWIMLDNRNPNLGTSFNPLTNGNWNRSFPFEPRYHHVSRQFDIARSLIATYNYQPFFFGPSIVAIVPTVVNGLIFGTQALGTAAYNYTYYDPSFVGTIPNTPMYEWFVDCNLSSQATNPSYYVTSQSPSQMFITASMPSDDMNRALFGFGDRNTCYQVDYGGSKVLLGTNHFPDARDVEGPHPDGIWTFYDTSNFRYSPVIRGWKYGVYSGIAAFSKAYFRRNSFGQFRDMLEQRPYTKFYQLAENATSVENFHQGVQPAAVTVTFLDPSSGRLTAPNNTWSSNLHFECTSSVPYFDGLALNRPTITPDNLNLAPNVVKQDGQGNIHIF